MDSVPWTFEYNLVPFLANRCSTEFLSQWYRTCPENGEKLVAAHAVSSLSYCVIVARLHRLGLLSAAQRQSYLDRAVDELLEQGEATFLADEVRTVLNTEEYSAILKRIHEEFVPEIESKIECLEAEYSDTDEEPSDYFCNLRSNLETLEDFFEDDEMVDALRLGAWRVDDAVERLEMAKKKREEEEKRKQEEERKAEESYDHGLEALVDEYQNSHRGGSDAANRQPAEGPSDESSHRSVPRDIFDDVDQ